MKSESGDGLDFGPIGLCQNPMESEIYPAALRDKEVPHRTRWDEDGNLILEVPREWRAEAARVLSEAARVFFSESFSALDENTLEAARAAAAERRRRHASEMAQNEAEEEDEEENGDRSVLFRTQDGLFGQPRHVPSSALQPKPVWPAWLLSAIPGLGLGHVYAGRARVALPLILFSATCLAYFAWSGSVAVLFFIAIPWAVDLGFAAYHVRTRNRELETLRRRAEEEERQLISELESDQGERKE